MNAEQLTKSHPEQTTNGPLGRLDFGSRFFDSTMTYYVGKDILAKAKKMQQCPDFQARLNSHFMQSDQPADRLAAHMASHKKDRMHYEMAIRHGIESVESPCEELCDFMRSATRIPDFIDPDKVALGGNVFRSKLDLPGLMIFGLPITIYQQAVVPAITMSLLFSNKPETPRSIQQTLSDKAGKRRGSVRLLETFKWFNKVAGPGAGDLYSDAFAENCRIRIVHAYVRRAISANKTHWNYTPEVTWDEAILGKPLSVADGSIVVSTLIVTLYAMRRHLKKNLSDSDLDHLNHWSNYVSYLQGVPETLLFPTFEETIVYFSAFMTSINTDAYQKEISAFIKELQELHFEKVVARKHKSVQVLLDGLSRATLHDTFDQRIRPYYNIKPAPMWAKNILWTTKHGISAINVASRYSPFLNNKMDMITKDLWAKTLPGIEEAVSTHYGSFIGKNIAST